MKIWISPLLHWKKWHQIYCNAFGLCEVKKKREAESLPFLKIGLIGLFRIQNVIDSSNGILNMVSRHGISRVGQSISQLCSKGH